MEEGAGEDVELPPIHLGTQPVPQDYGLVGEVWLRTYAIVEPEGITGSPKTGQRD